jgi:hypothetical protein
MMPREKRKHCIVLDLDHTLVYTQPLESGKKPLKDILEDLQSLPIRDRLYYFTVENYQSAASGTKMFMWGVARPHYREFLEFCDVHFEKVVVWSAGSRLYVKAIVEYLFRDLRPPEIVYSCEQLDQEKYRAGRIVKTLSVMLSEPPLRALKLEQTLALDDYQATFVDNPHNGILIPAYTPESTLEGFLAEDRALPQFQAWLLQADVLACDDVRLLNKERIFQ